MPRPAIRFRFGVNACGCPFSPSVQSFRSSITTNKTLGCTLSSGCISNANRNDTSGTVAVARITRVLPNSLTTRVVTSSLDQTRSSLLTCGTNVTSSRSMRSTYRTDCSPVESVSTRNAAPSWVCGQQPNLYSPRFETPSPSGSAKEPETTTDVFGSN